jgi:cellulose synthase/poly-beta-1,6-N-acetylglucosamine synthase-like glycosyltransferase
MLSASRLALVVTVAAWIAYVVTTIIRQFVNNGAQGMRFTSEAVSYLVVVTLLTSSALAYLVARHGFLVRARHHRRVPRAAIDDHFSRSMPTLTVLVPSYKEEARVVRQTLLSAALQEYPFQRIVLLVDDLPDPTDERDKQLLAGALALPGHIEELLAEPRSRAEKALSTAEHRAADGREPTIADVATAAAAYGDAAAWVQELADREAEAALDHTDIFLAEHVLGRLAEDLQAVGRAIASAAAAGNVLDADRLLQLHRRLVWTFRTEVSAFQRKRYVNLSHEPNKAMNLNSYIGLAGGAYREVEVERGVRLVPAGGGPRDLVVPDPDFLLTLDADSVLVPEYCLRLVHLMEQRENSDVAVAQTPYSSYPGSATRLERLAGATTDLQHISHQGMTHYDATFWVGANAVLRKAALDDIETTDEHEGYQVHRYIADRTVIEDTESSIDLVVRGWRLHNYPERLSYSATPPDFGSLSVQRQRWANGGLLILPKLWNQIRNRRRRGERSRPGELLLRINYMASICWASFGLLLLLAYPYSDRLLSPLVVLSAAPYFLAMASDLKRCGYKRLDVLRIYGFNLVFLPVNLSGVLTSLGQAITGRKIAFKRTPKVRNRTTASLSFVVLPYCLVAFSVWTLWRDILHGHWGHAVFAGTNAALTLYAIVAFIGLRHSLVDVVVNLFQRLRPRRRRAGGAPTGDVDAAPTWEEVLHYGSLDLQAAPALHQPRVDRLRDRRTILREEATPLPDDVLATLAAGLDNLAQGENYTVFRDADGFRINRSGRPIPYIAAPSAASDADDLEAAWEAPSQAPHLSPRSPRQR